ncbi:hypothetical protein LR48_Vigan08g076100 [Vigna angularis]|uniref:Uncharacterized protein n=1 Tax=Phaseolus angularis TaxID=3914 RepID=A0A0L9V5E9_PHAAN|nr:hypothetical protein LR48_Vigan08g076100 [Vigna angularis]
MAVVLLCCGEGSTSSDCLFQRGSILGSGRLVKLATSLDSKCTSFLLFQHQFQQQFQQPYHLFAHHFGPALCDTTTTLGFATFVNILLVILAWSSSSYRSSRSSSFDQSISFKEIKRKLDEARRRTCSFHEFDRIEDELYKQARANIPFFGMDIGALTYLDISSNTLQAPPTSSVISIPLPLLDQGAAQILNVEAASITKAMIMPYFGQLAVYRHEKKPMPQLVNEGHEEAEDDDDPLSILTSGLNKLRKGLIELEWELRTFGLEFHIPLYIAFYNAFKIIGGEAMLNISCIQLWYMNTVVVESGWALVYDFLEPQTI